MGAAWPASDKRTLNQLGDVCLSCLKRGPRPPLQRFSVPSFERISGTAPAPIDLLVRADLGAGQLSARAIIRASGEYIRLTEFWAFPRQN